MQTASCSDYPIDYGSLRRGDVEYLPERMLILAEFIGLENALRLANEHGGRSLSIPKGHAPGCPAVGKLMDRLRRVIGVEGAAAMVANYGGTRFDVPSCAALRHRLWCRALVAEFQACADKRGTMHAARVLSRRYRLSERWVYTLAARARAESKRRTAIAEQAATF